MKAHNLLTFEDVVPEFRQRYGGWADDRTRASDFVVGERYSTQEILIFVDVYDLRSGGMFVVPGEAAAPGAVVIKATLKDGAYPNAWIDEGRRLKYYFKAINGKFGDHFKVNAAILNNPGLPVLAFVRQSDAEEFTYRGVFQLVAPHVEPDGAKWFELAFATTQPPWVMASEQFIEKQLATRVERAKLDAREARLARLASAPRKPATTSAFSTVYVRNPDVIAEALHLARGMCGGCNKSAPFVRASDRTPYLEVHHRVPLAAGGDDTVENAIALCPNCHRERHFG